MERFHKEHYGQRWPPISSSLSIWNYAPCALHMRLNLTKLFMKIICLQLTPYTEIDVWIKQMQRLQLQFFPAFYKELSKTGQFNVGLIRPIGRDCDKLEEHLYVLLRKLRDQQCSIVTQVPVIKAELLWALWW